MEKINMKLFSTLKSLNRSIGNQIIDVTELYSPQKKSEAVEHEIIVKVKQRNKKYLENRKKKMLRSLELSPSELQLNDSVLDPNTTLSPSTKETQTLDDSKAPALNQLQTLNTNESLKQSINDKEQYRSMDVSLLPAVKGPIKPRLTLPGLRDTSVGRLNTLNKSESPAKNHISVLRSTKSTAHTSLILSFDKPSTINNPKPSPFSVSTRIIPKSLSVPRMRPVDHGVKGTRSLLVGKKIASYVIENCKGLTQGLQHNSIVPVSEQINNRKFLIDVYNNNIEMLSVSISKLDAAIKAIRSKFQIIDFVLSEFVSAGLHSHNIELHFSALRLQGKIQMKFSEFTKAITLYKTLRRIADFHIDTRNSNLLTESNSNCLRQKMFAYKRIAKCYQELQNYKLSIFYFIKMLQTAWLLKSADDELYIYDALGIQNYYLGDVKKSEFYHERAMKAILEPADSELRQLGIQKLLSNLIDVNNETLKKKRLRIKNIEADEEANEYPDSEDEFEMPEHHKDVVELRRKLEKMKKSQPRTQKRIVNYELILHEKEKKGSKRNAPRYFSQMLEDQKTDADIRWKLLRSELISKLEADINPPKPPVLINHLSSNRTNNGMGASFLDLPSGCTKGVMIKKLNNNVLPKQVAENLKDRMNELKRNLIFARDQVELLASLIYKPSGNITNDNIERY